MFRLHDIPVTDPHSHLVHVVIDTPKGSRNKYKYDEQYGIFRLSRVLPAGMQFPHDFGSIPRTRAADGDALDVLVLAEEPAFAGCLLTVRLLGVMQASQQEGGRRIRNDRLIAAVRTPVNQPAARNLHDIDGAVLQQIEHFFVSYNHAQGRKFTPGGRLGPAAAQSLLRKSMRAFAAAGAAGSP